jgi:hypothetical protein
MDAKAGLNVWETKNKHSLPKYKYSYIALALNSWMLEIDHMYDMSDSRYEKDPSFTQFRWLWHSNSEICVPNAISLHSKHKRIPMNRRTAGNIYLSLLLPERWYVDEDFDAQDWLSRRCTDDDPYKISVGDTLRKYSIIGRKYE